MHRVPQVAVRGLVSHCSCCIALFLGTNTSLEEDKEVPNGFWWEVPSDARVLACGRSVSNGILFIRVFLVEILTKNIKRCCSSDCRCGDEEVTHNGTLDMLGGADCAGQCRPKQYGYSVGTTKGEVAVQFLQPVCWGRIRGMEHFSLVEPDFAAEQGGIAGVVIPEWPCPPPLS